MILVANCRNLIALDLTNATELRDAATSGEVVVREV